VPRPAIHGPDALKAGAHRGLVVALPRPPRPRPHGRPGGDTPVRRL